MSAPIILNLGCGTKTSPYTVNIDFSIYQRLRKSSIGRAVAVAAIRGERRAKYDAMDDNLMVHDLRKGIPMPARSVDAVYHSHTQEHIDRADIPAFFAEVMRVLRPGGIHRVVVPDLELLVRDYLKSLESGQHEHDRTVYNLLEQSVRREAFGTSCQGMLRRRVENVLLGDARRRGETHQWMWDRRNLAEALDEAGFIGAKQRDAYASAIPNWQAIGLDLNPDGSVYRPRSLFMEARAPGARAF